jgi:hypothetical protein
MKTVRADITSTPTRRVIIPGVGYLKRYRDQMLYCICGAECRDTTKERRRFLKRHASHAVSDTPYTPDECIAAMYSVGELHAEFF